MDVVPIVYVIAAQVAFFIVMAVVLKRLILSDTMNAVQKLRQVEVEVSRKEDTIRKRMEENEQEFARKTAAAEEEFRKAHEASEKELARTRETLVAESKKERDRIIAEAEKHKDRMKQELLRDVNKQSVEYAANVFELVFSEQISADLNRSFIEELLAALEEVDSESIAIESDNMEFTSSHPLDDDIRQKIADVISRKFNLKVQIKEQVDPSLIAGLRIKLGGLEIDGSLRNRFNEAIEAVKKRQGF